MITVDRKNIEETVTVPGEFIRTYLPEAPGEYVKVYLYILMLSEKREEFTASSVAAALSCEEKDVVESLRFWCRQGLLELHSTDGEIRNIRFLKPPEKSPAAASAANIKALRKNNKEVAQLLYVAEQYLKRPLTRNDINVLLFFLNDLKLPLDVCEFVVEYCVLKGHPSTRYIEKVGMSWHDKGIRSVKEAKDQSGMWNKYHYDVLRAFGIRNRDPVTKEVGYIEKWRSEYGFSQTLIAEACSRTLAQTGKPSFEYADKIMKNWKAAHVKDLHDVEELDKKYKAARMQNGFRTGAVSVTASNASRQEVDFEKIARDRKRKEEAYRQFPRLHEIDKEASELSMKKVRVKLGMSDDADFDLEAALAALAEERREILIRAGFSPQELEDLDEGGSSSREAQSPSR